MQVYKTKKSFMKKFNIFLRWNKKIIAAVLVFDTSQLKKQKQVHYHFQLVLFELVIKYLIYQEMDAIDRSKTDYLQLFIYDVNRVSTSKIQRVSKTFGTYIQICAQFTKDEERDDPGLDKYHIVASSNTSRL